ncbi:acyl-CoA dehydrogenase family protein [Carboxydothermus hydrogenoformans]|uniref:Acyl-CoA dehydrogenase n=1 Tax=Carboxydothermus hydrogenoformans (strain ATCC BAA-161 / DSM 6008 / Z-2901) TaxID=246194 RepID=Q3ABP9_CARHZ|nr:acyl-CoA dehydrogenase family protein [Carboxydothermus hydrogenoformans]ABB14643.1 acyl-CoA dehydrogenase [Carboxydothermus hydrogenoformans Z-2901]
MSEVLKGGEFLIKDAEPQSIFTPEDFTEEHRMMAKMVKDFINNEVLPKSEEIENQVEGVVPALLRKAGELGLLSVDIPEAYGGMELDKVSTVIVTENVSGQGSFATAHGAHTGIGTLPIVYFGTEEQKKKYLPGLASGEKLAAYCLTEPGSGSDALAAKTKAVLSEDGKYYILNGTKQFITNAGFADVFIVYAKVDGDKFTAFIVERDFPGVSFGPEEKKMGIKGSSTRQVILEDVKVPVENVLGEVGKGHVIAFNILNIGRFKLGAGCAGSCKLALSTAVKYANERSQFGQPIANFGLIKNKIGRMAAYTFAAESMVYRTAGMMDKILGDVKGKSGAEVAKGIEEYAIEYSINKVFASEALDFVVDETVQIFGGYGYTQEYPAERMYRDARINRIFEGTNEINRLIIPAQLLRKAQKGQLPLLAAVQKLMGEIVAPLPPVEDVSGLNREKEAISRAKKLALMAAGLAVQKFKEKIEQEQEVLGMIADMAIEIYAMESSYLRAVKTGSELQEKYVKIFVAESFAKIEKLAKDLLAYVSEGDEQRTYLAVVRKFAKLPPVNTIKLAREVAEVIIDNLGYKA